MKKEMLEGLLKKGYITEETFKKGMSKFADGGVVPVVQSSSPNPLSPQNPTNPPVDPEIQQAAEAAKVNTIEQAQKMDKSPFSWMSDVEWSKLSPEQKVAAEDPNLARQQFGSSGTGLIKSAIGKVGEFVSSQRAKDEERIAKATGQAPISAQAPKTQIEQLGLQKAAPKQQVTAPQSPYSQVATGMDEAFAKMQTGITEEAIAGAKQAAAMTAAYTTAARDLQKFQEQQQVIEQERANRLKQQAEKFEAQVDDYKKNAVIDPNRYWASKSTGDKIMAGIAVFLGGVGGGTNEVLNGIDRAIQRDIDAQKTALMGKKEAISLQNNIYANMLNQFQDERAASTASRLALMNVAEMQIKKAEAATASLQVKAKAQQALGQLTLKKAELQQSLVKEVRNSTAMMAAGEEFRAINALPENLRSQGFKELGEYRQMQDNVQKAKNIFDEMNAVGLLKRADPTDNTIERNTAQLVTILKPIFPEALQEADIKRMLTPFIPGPLTSEKSKKANAEKFAEMIMQNAASKTPILSTAGIIKQKPNLSLKRND